MAKQKVNVKGTEMVVFSKEVLTEKSEWSV